MLRIFNPFLSNSLFFRPEQMYGENREIFENLSHIVHGNIYFLVERKRVRVDPSSIDVSADGFVTVDFLVEGDRRISSHFPFAPTVIDLGEKKMFRKYYQDAGNLQKYVVGVREHQEYLSRYSAHSPPLIGVSLNPSLQNKRNISLTLHTPDEQVGNMPFSVHSILSLFEIEIGDFPKILYIGKSEDLRDRVYRHERIQEALATVGDDSDIYLYAFQFEVNTFSADGISGALIPMVKEGRVTDVTSADQLAVVEMSLINYFKPKLNINYKHSDIPANPIFRRALAKKYDWLVLEIDHDGGFWNFGTEEIPASLRHQIEHAV